MVWIGADLRGRPLKFNNEISVLMKIFAIAFTTFFAWMLVFAEAAHAQVVYQNCPDPQVGTTGSNETGVYSGCQLSNYYMTLSRANSSASVFPTGRSSVTPTPSSTVNVGTFSDRWVADMGASYTGNCTEVGDNGQSSVSPSSSTVLCAIQLATNGTAIFTRVDFTVSGSTRTFSSPNIIYGAIPNTGPVANAGPDQTVSSASTVTLDGTGSTDADGDNLSYAWTQTSGTTVAITGSTSTNPTFTAPNLAVGAPNAVLVFSLTVNDGLVTSTADTVTITVSAQSATPATALSDFEDVIREQVQSVALQSIRNGVQEASGFMSSARDRFILCGDVSSGASSAACPSNIPFDIDGSTSVSTSSANIDGNFFGQFGNFNGTYRRMTSGDFNLQRDENGNTTGALSGRIAWEYLTSDTAMLGWFVGAEYIQSDMTGTFTGDQTSFGASIGGYFVTELQNQLYLDGHLTIKQNEHDLQLTNGTLDLDSLYHSTSVLSGLTLTGVTTIDESSELWPTFSINAARTDLGTIGFTGTAYGLTDSTLSMDGGLVSYADVSIAPKYRAAMDGQTLANSLLLATVTPKAMCEYTELSSSTSRNCGAGLLLGLLGTTKDGNGTLELELGLDSIGGAIRHSVALNADLRY